MEKNVIQAQKVQNSSTKELFSFLPKIATDTNGHITEDNFSEAIYTMLTYRKFKNIKFEEPIDDDLNIVPIIRHGKIIASIYEY